MFENPRRGRQVRNFTTNVSKILDLKSSSEQIFFRKLWLGAPEIIAASVSYHRVFIKQLNDDLGRVSCYFVDTSVDLHVFKDQRLIPSRTDCSRQAFCDLTLSAKHYSCVGV